MSDEERIGIVGSGTIGAGWAVLFLARGAEVSVTDPLAAAEAHLRRFVESAWKTFEERGFLAAGASLDRLGFTTDAGRALDGVTFIQESGPERLDDKRRLFAEMDARVPPEVVIASSTSGLVMSEIQTACRHPERCVVGHPFNPPHLMPLVEVVPGRLTSPAAVERAMSLYRRAGKVPILLKKEVPGHVANRLQAAIWREVIHLHREGVAGIEELDAAVRHGPGLRWTLMGPSQTFHLGGGPGGIRHFLDHLAGPMQTWWDDLGAPDLTEIVKRDLQAAIDAAFGGDDYEATVERRDAFISNLLDLRASIGVAVTPPFGPSEARVRPIIERTGQ